MNTFYFFIIFSFIATLGSNKLLPPKEHFDRLENECFYQYKNDAECADDTEIILNRKKSTIGSLKAYLNIFNRQIKQHSPLDNCQDEVKADCDRRVKEDYNSSKEEVKDYDLTLHIGHGKHQITDCPGGGRSSVARSLLFQCLIHIIPDKMYQEIGEYWEQDKDPKRIFSTASGTAECEVLLFEILAAKGLLQNLRFDSILFSDPKYNDNLQISMEAMRHIIANQCGGSIENMLYTNAVLGGYDKHIQSLLDVVLQSNNPIIKQAIDKVSFFMGFDAYNDHGTVETATKIIDFKNCLFAFMVCHGQFVITYFHNHQPLFFLITDKEKLPQNIYYFTRNDIDRGNPDSAYTMQLFNRGNRNYLTDKFFIGDEQENVVSSVAMQNFVLNFEYVLRKSKSIERIIELFSYLVQYKDDKDRILQELSPEYDAEHIDIINNLTDFDKINDVDLKDNSRKGGEIDKIISINFEDSDIKEKETENQIDPHEQKNKQQTAPDETAKDPTINPFTEKYSKTSHWTPRLLGIFALASVFAGIYFYLKTKNTKID